MAVFADSAEEEVDAARLLDGPLVCQAFGPEVGSVAVEDMDVLPGLVYAREQVLEHEGMVALGMALGKADILVHVEGDDVLEGNLACGAHACKLVIGTYGGGTGGKAQNEGFVRTRGLFADAVCNVAGGPYGAV